MQKKINVGDTFGLWTIIKANNSQRKYGAFASVCICNCGKKTSVLNASLLAGRSTKCIECARKPYIKYKELEGKKINDWKVVEYSGIKEGVHRYTVQCKCGYITEKDRGDIKKSSMCFSCSNKIKAAKNITHGLSSTKIYKVWSSMLNRCNTKTASAYEYYGGRGIRVCDSWHKFENFYVDMGDRLNEGLSIDRINNSKNYCIDNCRWATKNQQSSNTRRNLFFTANKQTKTLTEWSKELNTRFSTLKIVLNKYNMQEIIEILKLSKQDIIDTINSVNKKSYRFRGLDKNAFAWSKRLNISTQTIGKFWGKLNEAEKEKYLSVDKKLRGNNEAHKRFRIHEFNGKLYKLSELANEINVSYEAFRHMYQKVGLEKAIEYYSNNKRKRSAS